MQKYLGVAFASRDHNHWKMSSQFNEGTVRIRI